MLFSLPFFTVIGIYSGRKAKTQSLTGKQWANIILLALVGYYLARFARFSRTAIHYRQSRKACPVCLSNNCSGHNSIPLQTPNRKEPIPGTFNDLYRYFIAFAFDVNLQGQPDVGLGALLIFGSAFAYAAYLVGSGSMIPKIGTIRFYGLCHVLFLDSSDSARLFL